MADLTKILDEIKTTSLTTLSNKLNFDELRAINRDESGEIINDGLEAFLDWSFAILRRIPTDWQKYFAQPPADIHNLIQEISDILKRLEEIKDDPLASRASKLTGFSSPIQGAMSRTINSVKELLLLQLIGDDRSSSASDAVRKAQLSESRVENALAQAEQSAKKLNEMAAASQEVTAKIAASGRARIFHQDAKSYQYAARSWLGVTITLGAILVSLAFCFALGGIIFVPEDANGPEIATYIFSKILILGTIGAFLVFSGKQYSANRHNAVQNFHRSSALRTYRAMLSASRDEALHDAMLQQVAAAIFAPVDTGYSKSGSFDATPMVQLVQSATKGYSVQTP